MDFAKAILYFYLIFPAFNPQQSELIYKFGKEQLPVSKQIVIRKELMNYLFPLEQAEYIIQDEELTEELAEDFTEENIVLETEEAFLEETAPVFPDESDLIFEEGVPLPDGLENPEFGPQSAGSELLENTDEEKSIAEEMFINSMNKLSLFKYGEEQFAVNDRNSNKRVLVTVNKDTVIRIRYDEDFYLKDKIIWKNALTLKDSVILSKITYGYSKAGDGKKIVIAKQEEYPQEKRLIEHVYDKNGNPVEIIYSHFEQNTDKYEKLIEEAKEEFNRLNPLEEKTETKTEAVPDQMETSAASDNEETSEENPTQPELPPEQTREEKLNEYLAKIEVPQNKIQDRKIVRKYDAQNRLVSEEEAVVYEEPDPKRRGQKIKRSGSKKNVYTYTAKASVPDYIFYENGKMRIAVNYIDEDTYEQTLYFENDFSVRTRYNHGRKTREIFYSGITELKRTDFE